MNIRQENKFIAVIGTIGSIFIGWTIFTATIIDWAGVYLFGLLVVGLIIHIKHNVIGSN